MKEKPTFIKHLDRRSFLGTTGKLALSGTAIALMGGVSTANAGKSAGGDQLAQDVKILNTAIAAEHEAVADAREQDLPNVKAVAREGKRPPGAIGFSVTRGGGIIGDHAVRFLADMEEVTLSHRALDRRVFAKGALEAALWLHRRPSGLYGMSDVIG